VKAGWLERQTTILKRWQKCWFSLSTDGYLRYFENENKSIAEDTLFVPEDVKSIKIGEFKSAPDGRSPDHVLELVCHERSNWALCADSVDDMLAWQFAIEQARVNQNPPRQLSSPPPQYILDALASNPNNGYPIYYNRRYRGSFPSRVIQTPQGPVTLVFVDRSYYNRGYSGSNFAFGALAGAALASTFMWPLWWPIWWC